MLLIESFYLLLLNIDPLAVIQRYFLYLIIIMLYFLLLDRMLMGIVKMTFTRMHKDDLFVIVGIIIYILLSDVL